MGVIPNPKMAFIFPISCILALIFPNLLKYFPKCEGKGSFLKSQIKTLTEAKSAMNGNGFEEFNVYDGQNTFTIAEYEGNRGWGNYG